MRAGETESSQNGAILQGTCLGEKDLEEEGGMIYLIRKKALSEEGTCKKAQRGGGRFGKKKKNRIAKGLKKKEVPKRPRFELYERKINKEGKSRDILS